MIKKLQNFSTKKPFTNTVNPLIKATGVYLIIERGPLLEGALKRRRVKKIRDCKKLIKVIKFRYCV